MKTAKRLLTAALAVVFTFMCALPAMADDLVNQEMYTLTIDNPEAGHTYEAYQIFKGTFSVGTGKNAQGNLVNESYLSDINWGTGVVHEDETGYDVMIKALKEATPTLYDDGETLVAGVNDATKVAVALNNHNNAETADIFNEIVGGHLTDKFVTATAVEGKMVFANLTPGYYLVKDKDNSLAGKENESYTKYLVKLVDSTDISVKGQTMDLEKVILENNTAVKANNAAMGETVSYKLTSKTSTMDGYEDYTYIIHDEMDGGLTFNGLDNMTVTVGGEDYKANCEVTYSTDGTNYSETNTAKPGEKLYIQIKLKDLVKNGKTDQDVVVTYTATVNAKAVIGSAPNTNTAYLEYSNNPNQSQNGHSSTAKTPEKHVYTYVAGFEISKVSPADKLLPGAQFMIEGKDVTIVKLNVIGYSFEEAGEGSYYHVDNSYTTAAQTNYTGAMYDAKYGTIEKDGPQVVGMTSDKDEENGDKTVGTLRFNGLKEGTYTITEVLAPTGYKKLDEDITLVVKWSATADENGNHWSYAVSSGKGDTDTISIDKDGVLHFNIVNQHGLTLPFTGGEGANLLAGLGLALMAAAVAAILYIKRRQNRE